MILEGLEHLNLCRHIEGCCWLIENQQVRITAKGHRGHQALKLPARNLFGNSSA